MSIQVVKKCLVGKCPGQTMSGQEMSGQKLENREKGVEKCRSRNVWSRNVHESHFCEVRKNCENATIEIFENCEIPDLRYF